MTETEKKILAMQSPATQRRLRIQMGEPTKEDLEWKAKDSRAVPNAKTWEERVAWRPLSEQEIEFHDGANSYRRNRGQYLAEMRKEKDATSVTPKKWQKAVDAWLNPMGTIKVKFKHFKELMAANGLANEKELVMLKDEDRA